MRYSNSFTPTFAISLCLPVHPDRCLRIWPDSKFSPSAKQRDLYTLPDEVTFLTQCPERHLIFVGCANGEVVVWQASLAALFVKFYANGCTEAAMEAVDSPSSPSSPLGGSNDKAVAVEFIVPLPPPADKSAQGALLVCCSDAVIRTWDLGLGGGDDPQLLSETHANHVGMLFSSHCVSTDKTTLFTSDVEGFLKVWDLRGDCSGATQSRRGSKASDRRSSSSLVGRPGKATQVDHWRGSRRPINSIGYIKESVKSPALLITTSQGMDAFFWTLDGIRVGTIGEGMAVLWNTLDPSTWDGHQEKAEDLAREAHDDEDELDDQQAADVLKKLSAGQEDRRTKIKDMVTNIFESKKSKKNSFKIDRTMNALKVRPPRNIAYREGTGPAQLQTLEIGKPRTRKKTTAAVTAVTAPV